MAELFIKPYLIRGIYEWCKDCACGRVGRDGASAAGATQFASSPGHHD